MLHLTSLTYDLCHMTSCHITKLKWLTVKTICIKNKLETKYYYISFGHAASVHNTMLYIADDVIHSDIKSESGKHFKN